MTRRCASAVRRRSEVAIHGVAGLFLAAFAFDALPLPGGARGAVAQQSGGWTFTSDPFADLWFHGLAIVGFDGFGRVPLYDAEYAWDVTAARRGDTSPSELELARGELLAALMSDPAFEVLHFVPLYFADAPVDMALDALEHLGDGGASRTDPRVAREVTAIGSVLVTPEQRSVVTAFVRALRAERPFLTRRRAQGFDIGGSGVAKLWKERVQSELGAFLAREQFTHGTVVMTPALGTEGRFLDTDGGVLVMVGVSADAAAPAVVGAVLRELCYPAVRRAVAPYESRIEDRRVVSDVSDLAATRCADLLLERHAAELLPPYRARFGVGSSSSGFLSAAGLAPGVAALERELDAALARELNLSLSSDRAEARPAGR